MEPVWYLLSGDTGLLWDTDVYRVLSCILLRSRREPEHLPYEVIVYDRSNKGLLLIMGLYVRSKMGVLYLYDATELGRQDVSHLVE